MGNKRTYEERIREKDDRMQKAREKAKQYEAQKKQLEKMQKAADRKARTKRLIEIGGAVESVLGRPFREDDHLRLMNFLKQQEANGSFFTKAMEKPIPRIAKEKASEPMIVVTEEADIPT